MNPARPTVDWATVSTYQFHEEFKLLQDSHGDLTSKRWANPEVRATLKLVRRIRRAHEEITRLNVEVRRVHTAIRDEEVLFTQHLDALSPSNVLRSALQDFVNRRRRVN